MDRLAADKTFSSIRKAFRTASVNVASMADYGSVLT